MSLAELWRLFPISLEEHNPLWAGWYAEEETNLRALPECADARIDHIGSTYIKGLPAKPIVDILLQNPPATDAEHLKSALIGNGWQLMSENPAEQSLDFNKGYTPEGFAERVFHLHVRPEGRKDEILFRDYIAAHPSEAAAYAALKRRLLKQYAYDRDAYTEAKSEFILGALTKARKNEPQE